MKTLERIMLVDDNFADNYFHTDEIKATWPDMIIIEMSNAIDALKYLDHNRQSKFLPDLIFLDLNMPGMDGWGFLEAFQKLQRTKQDIMIVILSTSKTTEEIIRSKAFSNVIDYIRKPLTSEFLKSIFERHFLNS
jgi:response regulator RpfG family c-di-GMP phosphodiesterase